MKTINPNILTNFQNQELKFVMKINLQRKTEIKLT